MSRRMQLFGSFIVSWLVLLSACGGGGGKNTSAPPPTSSPPAITATVSGTAGKGLLLNAVVNFYAVSNGVASTTALATARTDATTGAFSSSVTSSGPVLVTVSTDANTQMLDELSGNVIAAPSGLVLHAVLESLANLQPIGVTPLTEMVYQIANSAGGGLTAANINAAATAVSTAFLGGASALTTQPIDIENYASAPVAQQQLAKLLAALAVAADQGSATDASGAACSSGDYSQRLVCMVSGLGSLIELGSGNQGVLQSAANYIGAAYALINSGHVTIDGQSPSALGLNVATQAETSFLTAIATQAPLPGYDPGASPLANTKALLADIRTNILDPATRSFGPTVQAVGDDFNDNVRPALVGTGAALNAMKLASDLMVGAKANPSYGSTSDMIAPWGIAVGSAGQLYVTSLVNSVVRINTTGDVATFAGMPFAAGTADGPADQARFGNPIFSPTANGPFGMATDGAGNLYVADAFNSTIRRITPAGTVSTLAGSPRVPGHVDGTGSAARFGFPFGLAVDGAGNVYVSDQNTIRRITSAGVVSTIAGQPGVPSHVDGVGTAARFNGADAVAVDAAGNVYVSETGGHTVRRITPAGVVSTLAGQDGIPGSTDGTGSVARFNVPRGLAVDSAGNVYVADWGNATIRRITPAGVVTTIAGQAGLPGNADGTGTAATFTLPAGLTTDGVGNLYVADVAGGAVRRIDSSGTVSTVARTLASYRESGSAFCGYDPLRLGGNTNLVVCRYGEFDNAVSLGLTETAAGTYTVHTRPLVFTPDANVNPLVPPMLANYTLATDLLILDASFTVTGTTGRGLPTGTASGPLYINSSGAQVTAALAVAVSDDWNAATGSGTLSLSGTLSNGSGGIALSSATIGADSSLVIKDTFALLDGLDIASLTAPPSIQGTLNISELTTPSFSYAAKLTLGAPVLDKSGKIAPPGSVELTGSVARAVNGNTTPLFNGRISAALMGVDQFDATQSLSATNFVTAQVQIAGELALEGGRLLSVMASANGSQLKPTPESPDSLLATYSYATPRGTAVLNASARYDGVNGYSATISNNAGVTATLAKPIDGEVTGTLSAGDQQTATISGSQVNYSDGTVESLF